MIAPRALALACLAGCGETKPDVRLDVGGCIEAEVRVQVFDDGDACVTEDPSASRTSALVPRWDSGWQDRPRDVGAHIGDADVTVVAWCRDRSGVVRGWGCASESGGRVDVAVTPTCVCWPQGECGDGAGAWSGASSVYCVERCAGSCGEQDAGPAEDAGPEGDGGGACVEPRGTIVETIPAEAGAPMVGLARDDQVVVVATGDGGVQAFQGRFADLSTRDGRELDGPATGVTIGDGLVYVATETDTFHVLRLEGLDVLASPVLDSGTARGIAALPDHALVAAGEAALRLFDVSSPEAPDEVANHPPSGARAIALAGGFAVVGADQSLALVDVADLPSLRGSGSADTAGSVVAVAVGDDELIAAAEGEDGVELFTIDDSDHLEVVTAAPIATGDRALGVAFQAGLLYVADGDAGLNVVDVTDAASPAAVLAVALPEGSAAARAVLVDGAWALVAAGATGLHVVHLECLP